MKRVGLSEFLERLGGERRIDYTLERFVRALAKAGNPHKNVQTIVIAGTNGKGTVSLLVANALREAGFRVGTYLSPHLQHPRERFLDDMRPESEAYLMDLAEELEPLAHEFSLTYFEFLTLVGFTWSSRKQFDFLVLEVGLGGRLDATNVTDPLACAITTIDYDHREYLGDTLEAILDEKMGILRPESLLFTGVTQPDLLRRIEKRCEELDAIYYYGHEMRTEIEHVSWEGQSVRFNDYPFELTSPSPGAAQNAAVALLLLRIVFPKIPMDTFQRAFRAVRNPARMEIVQASPRVVLSGDHNPAGIACLKETLKRIGAEKVKIVCGFSPDKPYAEMYGELKAMCSEILLTQVTRLKDKMPADYAALGTFEPDPSVAVDKMLARTGSDETLLVTGSLYLCGELRPRWKSSVEFVE